SGMAFGALLLMLAPTLIFTLSASFIMGLCGTILLVMIQSGLANAHGDARGTAITEANVTASIGSTVAPLAVGAFVVMALNWRLVMLIPIGLFLLMLISHRTLPFPSLEQSETKAKRGTFSFGFWVSWLGLVLGVAAEWSIAFWTADFLITVLGQSAGIATASVAIFTASGIIGRLTASRLAQRFNDRHLLIGMLILALFGALIFRFSGSLILTWLGLAIMGFGVATVYPLGVSTLITYAPEQSNRASARASLGAAIAILVAPQVLGIVADITDIATASTMIPALILGTLILTGLGKKA
ncbi:MAG: MFS transporter, partial [Chloroflexota bacterium]